MSNSILNMFSKQDAEFQKLKFVFDREEKCGYILDLKSYKYVYALPKFDAGFINQTTLVSDEYSKSFVEYINFLRFSYPEILQSTEMEGVTWLLIEIDESTECHTYNKKVGFLVDESNEIESVIGLEVYEV